MYTLLSDVLLVFESIHKEATRHLLLLSTGEDYAPLLISLLFSSLFTLPSPPTRPVYYSAIILDLFKLEPQVMPPIIGLAINTLFERLDGMDMECFDRMVNWFAFHLSNFSYVWPWENWSAVLETDEYTAQRVMVGECYERMVRLSFWERIQQTVPEELMLLMPHQPIPAFRFEVDSAASTAGGGVDGMEEEKVDKVEGKGETEGSGGLAAVAKAVLDRVREKTSAEELVAYLDSSLSASSSLSSSLSSPLQLLLPCLLHAGHKSYSHLFALFDRYAPAIAHFIPLSPLSPLHIVRSVAEYWQHSHQHVLVVLDRVMERGWVRPAVVVEWALGGKVDDMQKGTVWEVVAMAMDRVMERASGGSGVSVGGGQGEAVEGVAAVLVGLSRVLRVGSANEGLRPYVESRVRGVIRKVTAPHSFPPFPHTLIPAIPLSSHLLVLSQRKLTLCACAPVLLWCDVTVDVVCLYSIARSSCPLQRSWRRWWGSWTHGWWRRWSRRRRCSRIED